ncbi:MAG: hypothetical protein KGQ37_00210 [Hyphomicrobiales bacterium]|nr:hypothetical protein [Hyphomicrobiales bacterium]
MQLEHFYSRDGAYRAQKKVAVADQLFGVRPQRTKCRIFHEGENMNNKTITFGEVILRWAHSELGAEVSGVYYYDLEQELKKNKESICVDSILNNPSSLSLNFALSLVIRCFYVRSALFINFLTNITSFEEKCISKGDLDHLLVPPNVWEGITEAHVASGIFSSSEYVTYKHSYKFVQFSKYVKIRCEESSCGKSPTCPLGSCKDAGAPSNKPRDANTRDWDPLVIGCASILGNPRPVLVDGYHRAVAAWKNSEESGDADLHLRAYVPVGMNFGQ